MAKRQGQYAKNIELAHYPAEVRQMMDETETCLNCGEKLTYIQRKDGRRNRGYCCLRCYIEKPPKMAYAEKAYGKPIKKLILQLLNEGKTVQATANLLGIEKPNFYVWLKKLGIKRKVMWV